MLYFNCLPVAVVSGIFLHQGTWFANYSLIANVDSRVSKFVKFSRDQLSTEDFDENALRSFADLRESNSWQVKGAGITHQLEGAPLFRETELSWISDEV